MKKILSSVDSLRVRRRVAELVASGVAEQAAVRKAKYEIGKARARISRGESALGDWSGNIVTRAGVRS